MGGKIKPRQQRKPKGQTRDMIPNYEPKRERQHKRKGNRQDWRHGWDNNDG